MIPVIPALLLPLSSVQELEVPYTTFELENGLRVVLHEDHSNPVVAVYVSYHVGSAREEPGRSGFAHLFEHMLFQGSANVADDEHFQLVSEAGGTLNGTTNTDRTIYFETMPSNQLELALWLEADRMGFLLPAVTQEKLDNQREVVKNERRQNYENRPYGQSRAALAAAMFPPGHPYSWLTIGSHADLSAASLEDVRGFFQRWYGPNNATLAIGGDIDPAQARAWVERYFGPIPRGPEVAPMAAQPVTLEQDERLVLEDKVQFPRLTLSWPGVIQFSADDAALHMLAMLLSENKASLLERALTIESVRARDVSARNDSSEIAGVFTISVTAAPGIGLDEIEQDVDRILEQLHESGVDPDQLQRMKNRYEASFVRGLETVSARTGRLATSSMFTGDPTAFLDEATDRLAVTAEDVERVLETYLIERPRVILSVVPEGRLELAASGRSPAQREAELALDRATRPGAASPPEFHSPEVWHSTLANGVEITGTPSGGLPLTQLRLAIPGGRLHETMKTLGISSLTAEMLNEGTRELSTTEFADALDFLGASLWIDSDDDEITLSLSVLDKHLDRALELFATVLLEPRFDPADFERVRARRLMAIDARGDSSRSVARNVWTRANWGDGAAGMPASGTRTTVEALTLDDVRGFYERSAAPEGSRLIIVSALGADDWAERLAPLVERWPARGSEPVEAALALVEPAPVEATHVLLVDKPGAAQSELRIGHPSVSSLHPDYYPLTVLNYVLGGAFSSRINMNLREDKGYTYGARSSFPGGTRQAAFTASAGVRTDATAASVAEFMKELEAILDGVTEEELAHARSALRQALLRQYESGRSRLSFLDDISRFGWPDDYPEQQLARLDTLTVDELRALARKHLQPDAMRILVVGDKEAVAEGLTELGYGEPAELDIDGAPVAGD